jgi:hypothetical protein
MVWMLVRWVVEGVFGRERSAVESDEKLQGRWRREREKKPGEKGI